MKSKKLLSLFIVLAMIAATVVMPMTASAETTKKTMNMGGSIISVRDNIYYGYNNGAKKWRVLSTNGSATDGDGDTLYDGSKDNASNALFVISENNFDNRAFDSENNQMWQTDTNQSEAKQWCNEIEGTSYESNGFYTTAGITGTEKAAILTTSKTDAEYIYFKATSINDKVFYLSANEAETYFNDNDDRIFVPGGEAAVWWWLRSPY